MNKEIIAYNTNQIDGKKLICDLLASEIVAALPDAENKVWHGAPVWFMGGNPVAGYTVLKDCVQLLFWSGQSFDEDGLQPEGSFRAAQSRYSNVDEVDTTDLARWLKKAEDIQWDYKNIVKRKGQLERLK